MSAHDQRLAAARLALEGLSVGDAFGRGRRLPDSVWRYSDDTEMAIAILEVLEQHRAIDEDALAAAFARRFTRDPERGYGAMAYWLLFQLSEGRDWRTVSKEIFRGQGSLGNGAAMRAAPVGAYFSDDLNLVADQARRSAIVTHAHPDGQAGAIATAIAAAVAHADGMRDRQRLFEAVLHYTPEGPTRDGIGLAASSTFDTPQAAAKALGDGTLVRSSDTVPLSLWCAARHLGDFEAALETALHACATPESDRDTVCAIVGSIVVLASGFDSIPTAWHQAREPLAI